MSTGIPSSHSRAHSSCQTYQNNSMRVHLRTLCESNYLTDQKWTCFSPGLSLFVWLPTISFEGEVCHFYATSVTSPKWNVKNYDFSKRHYQPLLGKPKLLVWLSKCYCVRMLKQQYILKSFQICTVLFRGNQSVRTSPPGNFIAQNQAFVFYDM